MLELQRENSITRHVLGTGCSIRGSKGVTGGAGVFLLRL